MRIKFVFIILLSLILSACSSSGTTTGTTDNGEATDDGGGGSSGGGTDNGTDDGTDGGSASVSAIIADHSAVVDFSDIPAEYIDQAKTNFRIYYGHTSHGSQIITGLEMLDDAIYDKDALSIEEYGGDLGTGGDTTWATTTRTRLDTPGSNINIVMWSWCGGVSGNSTAGIDAYLNAMNQLEQDYPDIRFLYMTGHTDGTGAAGSLRINNQRIRDYVQAHNKILFDFEDIESWEPDGTYHADTTDACDWCTAWCGAHSCPACGGCAHSHCFNCNLKGQAFWWLMARMAGWGG